jgi:hypothetical protein
VGWAGVSKVVRFRGDAAGVGDVGERVEATGVEVMSEGGSITCVDQARGVQVPPPWAGDYGGDTVVDRRTADQTDEESRSTSHGAAASLTTAMDITTIHASFLYIRPCSTAQARA